LAIAEEALRSKQSELDGYLRNMRETKEDLHKAQSDVAKERERRRDAEMKVIEMQNDRDQEADRRISAETQADELIFQRDLLDAELKALEEKTALNMMGVPGIKHVPVQLAGMDRHALEKELAQKEIDLKEEGRKNQSQQEIWNHDRASLQSQLTQNVAEVKRLRTQLDDAREEELRLRREMDSRVAELVRAQGDRVAADEMRQQLSMEAQKLREEKKKEHFSVRELNDFIERLSAENDTLRSKFRRVEGKKTELEDEVETLGNQLRAAQRGNYLLNAGITEDQEHDPDDPRLQPRSMSDGVVVGVQGDRVERSESKRDRSSPTGSSALVGSSALRHLKNRGRRS